MINIPLTKILFLDIETVGIQPDWKTLELKRPELAFQFENYFDWFLKRFPEDGADGVAQMFVNRSALVPEFARIACVSVAFVTENGETKMQSFSDPDEKLDDALENYVNDSNFERKIRRAAAFFPIMAQD